VGDPVYLAAAIALLVSLNFGFANHFQHIALDHLPDPQVGTIINVATTAAMFWLLSPLFLVPETLLSPSAGLFALAGLIVPAASISLTTLSVKMIGPGLTAGLASTSPVFAMVLAVIFLGELVSAPILIGTGIVIAGIMLIAFRSKTEGMTWPLWAIALPLLAALTRGITHPLIKYALTGLPSPMTAALISSTVSLVVLAIAHRFAGGSLPTWSKGYLWFALCGVINGMGIVGLNYALSLGKVVVVSPLVATTPAFTLLLGYFVFRRETIRWPAIAAIAMIFAGSILILTR